MSKRKPRPETRSVRPMAESLETRQLLSVTSSTLSAVVKGTDPDGAEWTLRLFGPGALSVLGTSGDSFGRNTQNMTESIQTITVGGSISTETRLVGTVKANPANGDSRVYFENLLVTNSGELGKIDVGQVSNFRTVSNGIEAIDMPDFYLAHTETTPPSSPSLIHTNADSAGVISIPEGVNTLRFGGVDVDYTPKGGTPLTQLQQNNEFQISLGIPIVVGTSIIVNTVNSDAVASTTTAGATFQDYATFLVTGRLNLFQANSITGNTTAGLVPSQFPNQTTPTTSTPGGTFLVSQGGPATGQIGDVRVGGTATNFTTLVTEDPLNVEAAEGQLDAKISNFYIGGQTDNVLLMAPSGSRNIAFGLGLDNVTINSLAIQSLRANRDALDSTVTVSRSLSNLLIGGDVTSTNVNVGQGQSLFTFTNVPATIAGEAGSGVFFGDLPPTVATPQTNPLTDLQEPFAQNGGTMKVRIAGSVTNSLFTASVDGNPSQSLSPLVGPGSGDLVLPRGVINAKVEGQIDNSGIDTNSATPLVTNPLRAFYARTVHLTHGAVIPPSVPYAPTVSPTPYDKGQAALKGLFKIDHRPRINLPNVSRHKTKKSK
jgi:hypothetical protein